MPTLSSALTANALRSLTKGASWGPPADVAFPDGPFTVESGAKSDLLGGPKAAARTRDALWTAIGRSLDGFSPDECRNYLANPGYEFE